MKQKFKKQKGFTLVEIIVVVGIIALVASIVLLYLGSARTKGRNGKRVGDAVKISATMSLAYGKIPNCISQLPAVSAGQCAYVNNPTNLYLQKSNDGAFVGGTVGCLPTDIFSTLGLSTCTWYDPSAPQDSGAGAPDNWYVYAAECDDSDSVAQGGPASCTSNSKLGYGWELNICLETDGDPKAALMMANDGGNQDDAYEVGTDLTLLSQWIDDQGNPSVPVNCQ